MTDTRMATLMRKVLFYSGLKPELLLKFSKGNRKFDDVFTISLPAGHSCPFAKDCRSCATIKPVTTAGIKSKGFGIQDGPHTQFRCYTAIDEALKPVVRENRWHNYILLMDTSKRGVDAVVELLEKSLPATRFLEPTRIHVAGDFFNQIYFDAWLEVARRNSHRKFYAYTKALPFWVKRLNDIPSNLKLIASYGGTHDHLIPTHNLRFAKVVKSVWEARRLKLKIDHDDKLAYASDESFALLVHGQQPAKTVWARAWSRLKSIGMGGYGRQKAKTTGLGGSKSESTRWYSHT